MSLKKALDEIMARFSTEILAALSSASVEELQDALPNARREPRAKRPTSVKPSISGHALERLAVRVVGYLREHGPTRSVDLRKALGVARTDLVGALALATTWKMVSKAGEKKATTFKALKQRGPKAQLTLGDRLRVANLVK